MGSIDSKKLEIMMKSIGDHIQSDSNPVQVMEELMGNHGNKKEEEIVAQLKKLNIEMLKDQRKYKQQMEAIAQLKGFLNEGQKKKLENIMANLNHNHEK